MRIFFVFEHALQIHVKDLVLGRMTLHILQDRGLLLASDAQRDDRGIEALVHQQRQQILMIQNQLLRLLVSAVKNRRNLAGTTQAAARTLPLHAIPRIGDEIKRGFHV